MKRETVKRVLALLICVWMTVSLLPAVAMAEEVTEDVIDDSTIEAYTSYENGEDAGVSGVSVTDEKPNTDIKVIPSDANALILMDTGAQSPKGVPGQVVKIVLPLAVNKEYLPSEKYMLRNINIYPDVPTDASVSNWPFELIYASDVQHLKDMSYNSTAEVWFEFKISEFASKGRYAVPFKINATVWREDAVNGTTITEDVTFKVSAYVTVTDNGNMSGVTTAFGSLQVAGTNAGGSYTVPTGTPNQTISMRIPVINVGGTLTSVTVYPVVSTSLDEFPFVVDSTNYGKYFDYWASGEIKYLDYTFTVSPFATSGNKAIKFKATYFENSAAAEGSFSTQFTVIDGYDASAMSVMVQSYKLYVDDTEVSGLMAGEETELRLTLINNSKFDTAKKVISSLVFTNSPGLTLCVGGTDTAYADSIKLGGTAVLKYKIMAKQDAEVGPVPCSARAAATAAASAVSNVGYCSGLWMWVEVVTSTVPRRRSSSASVYISVVLPPPPMRAVTPFSTSSRAEMFIINPPAHAPIRWVRRFQRSPDSRCRPCGTSPHAGRRTRSS